MHGDEPGGGLDVGHDLGAPGRDREPPLVVGDRAVELDDLLLRDGLGQQHGVGPRLDHDREVVPALGRERVHAHRGDDAALARLLEQPEDHLPRARAERRRREVLEVGNDHVGLRVERSGMGAGVGTGDEEPGAAETRRPALRRVVASVRMGHAHLRIQPAATTLRGQSISYARCVAARYDSHRRFRRLRGRAARRGGPRRRAADVRRFRSLLRRRDVRADRRRRALSQGRRAQPARARARRLRAFHLRSEGPAHDHGLLACAGRRDGVARADGALGAERARRGAAGEGRASGDGALTAQVLASEDEARAP